MSQGDCQSGIDLRAGTIDRSAFGPGATVYNTDYRLYPLLKDYVVDFSGLRDSVESLFGRKPVFDALGAFVSQHDRGYYTIIGDAGLGKTALAAAIAGHYQATSFFFSVAE